MLLSKNELESVDQSIDSKNYYNLLKVSPLASKDEIQDSFHKVATLFHPDRYFSEQDPFVQVLSKRIYLKMVQAYQVLSNEKKREAYDKDLRGGEFEEVTNPGSGAPMQVQKKPAPPSASGLKFFKLAQSAFTGGNYQSASMNIQLALNSDPENAEFLRFSDKVKSELKRGKK